MITLGEFRAKCKTQKVVSAKEALKIVTKLEVDREKTKHYSRKHIQMTLNENKKLKQRIKELEGKK